MKDCHVCSKPSDRYEEREWPDYRQPSGTRTVYICDVCSRLMALGLIDSDGAKGWLLDD